MLTTTPNTTLTTLPIWFKLNSKITMESEGQYLKGYLQLHSNSTWPFQETAKNGKITKEIPFNNFLNTYKSLVQDNMILPGWEVHSFMPASLVSATPLINPCPSSLTMALDPSNPDRTVWLDSYSEEYNGIKKCDVYDIISEREYLDLRHKSGIAIPSMCILTIKFKNDYPHRAKSRIVVLGKKP